jgi:hypothetical protein
MRATAWEGIGKELKIKFKFYVSLRDMRIVCPRLNGVIHYGNTTSTSAESHTQKDNAADASQPRRCHRRHKLAANEGNKLPEFGRLKR